jgi:hypothetical protein
LQPTQALRAAAYRRVAEAAGSMGVM